MSHAVFDYQQFYSLIERFSQEVPEILRSHRVTADLAPRVSSLLDVLETTFTVAAVGQMRSGKSSLLNALMGADLAVTGVTETTATINHFVYGTGEQCRKFRVYWRDRPLEDFPLDEIKRWVGHSELARATRRIEFFADIDFLRFARLVDTPGTRSVIGFHEQVTRDFLGLADRLDEETRRQGCAADAVIYVVMPVARQTDEALLDEFKRNTRLPGSTPYNSIAVVHKWETLEVDSPFDEAFRKAERIAQVMGELVSAVIPVSAPLARAAESFPDQFWDDLLRLCRKTPAETIEELLISEQDFQRLEDPRCSLTAEARRELRRNYPLPWPSLKAIIQLGHARQPDSPEELRELIRHASQIDVLRNELQRRFFARSQMIRAFSVLTKALDPCQEAAVRLRNHKRQCSQLLEQAQDAIRQLNNLSIPDAAIIPIRRYLETTRSLVENDLHQVAVTLQKVDRERLLLQDSFEDMHNDLWALAMLEERGQWFGDEWNRVLRYLFGYAGPEINVRLGPLRDLAGVGDDLSAALWGIAQIRQRWSWCPGDLGRLVKHALARLQQLADDRERRGGGEETLPSCKGTSDPSRE